MKQTFEASYTVEASVIMSVILLATGAIICFGYRQKANVVASYKTRYEAEFAGHEQEDHCPEEYMRQMTLWEGLKEAYLRKNNKEADGKVDEKEVKR